MFSTSVGSAITRFVRSMSPFAGDLALLLVVHCGKAAMPLVIVIILIHRQFLLTAGFATAGPKFQKESSMNWASLRNFSTLSLSAPRNTVRHPGHRNVRLRRGSTLSRRSTSSPMLSPMMVVAEQNQILRRIVSAVGEVVEVMKI